MLITGDSGSGKTDGSLNLIKEQDNDVLIDKIYFYAKDLNEPKYQFLIQKCEGAGMYLNDPKAFIEYSHYMDDVYNNINNYNPKKKKIIVFDDIIADIVTNKKFQLIILLDAKN